MASSGSASRRPSRPPRRSPTRWPTPSVSGPQHPDHACESAGGSRTPEVRRHAVKAFAYVNAANEKDALAALVPERGRALPLGGGQDLLALMKDYIAQPDRLVNVKALDATIVPGAGGGLRSARPRRSSSSPSTRREEGLPGAGAGRARGRHAADPERRHGGWQPLPAATVLVLPQRGVRVPEEGWSALFRRGRREPVPRHLRRGALPHRPPVEPCGAARSRTARGSAWLGRMAIARCRPRSSSSCPTGACTRRTCSVPRAADARDLPAPGNVKSATYEVRYKQSHDWPIAFATVALTLTADGAAARGSSWARWRRCPGGRARPRRELTGKSITEAVAERAAAAAVARPSP